MPPSMPSLIQRLERLTHTDLKYLSGGSFWLMLSQGVNILSGLASSVAFARLVAPENYGTYRYLLSIYGMLSIFTLPGIRTAMTRSISQGQTGALPFGIKLQIKAALVGSVVSLGLAGWYALQSNHLLALGMLTIALFLPFTDTLDISSFFQGTKRFNALFLYGAAITLTSLCAALLGIKLGGNPLILLLLFLGGIAFVRSVIFWSIHRHTSAEVRSSETSLQEIARFGTQLSFLSIISIAANSLDKILLFHYLNPVVVANYAFATSLPNQLRGIVRNLGTLALPKFSNRSEQEVYRGLVKRLPFLLGGIAIIVLAYLISAPFIFRHLFPRYLEVLPYSQLFSLSIFDSVTYPLNSALTAHKKTKILTFFTSGIYVVDLTLLFILTPLWGLSGVIMAKLISRAVTITLGGGILYRLTRERRLIRTTSEDV